MDTPSSHDAALLLLMMGEEQAAEVLRHLDSASVEKIGLAMAAIRGVKHEQADEVASFVRATARRLDCEVDEHPIALGGSVLRHGRDLMESRIRAAFPHHTLDLRFPDFPPVVGAAVEALRAAGADPSPDPEAIAAQLARMTPAA